jgi:hypothetical protein
MDKYPKKLVAVLSEKIQGGLAMNVLAHMAAGLGASATDKEQLRLVDYADGDGSSHPNISELPFIILKARSQEQLKQLRQALIQRKVYFVDFPSYINSIGTFESPEKSRQFREPNIEYYGIAMFDDWDTITELTRPFSLWR